MDSNQFGFTGRLNIYDVEKEVSYRIETDQADSEILLVEDGKVYYRIANRLYEGRIAEKEITGTKLLATSDLLYDAHWAWIRR
jgi:hypothetical protein